MDVHPSGDHLIVGGYDRKLCWFDLELSEKPYKVMKYVHPRPIYSNAFLTVGQVPLSSDPLSPLPPHISPLRLCLRRRLDPDFPLPGVQRPYDGPSHCTLEDLARPPGHRRTRRSPSQMGAQATLVGERSSRRDSGGMVQLNSVILIWISLAVESIEQYDRYWIRRCGLSQH